MGLFDVGDDEGGTSFLANLHNQQRKLDNLGPSSSKPGDSKSIAVQEAPSQVKKAGRFEIAAADDDDDDFFAEFDVDLDMDGDSTPPKQALSTIPEKSSNMDLNPASDSAADGTAVEASSAPMATDQLTSGFAAPDAAPQTSDGGDILSGSATGMGAITGTCDGQVNTTAMALPPQDFHSESAAAAMENNALNKSKPIGNEAVQDAEASAPTSRAAPIPMLSQVADDPDPSQHHHAVAHDQLASEVEATQLHAHHATTQPPGSAATAQPSDSHDTYPAEALATGQSEHANPIPRSECNQPMTEADGDHAPSQQAGTDTSNEPANNGATTQLVQGVPATVLAEGTAHAEPADAEPASDGGAVPMQTDLPTPTDQTRPSVHKPDQTSSVAMTLVEALETAQPQAELQSSNDAQHSTQPEGMAKTQSELDRPALDSAGSDAIPDRKMADTTRPAEASITSTPGTVSVQQDVCSTGAKDTLAHGFAQPDTDMVPVTSYGEQPSVHPMPDGELEGGYPGPSKQILPAASEAQSGVELRHASERANSPSGEASPSSPAGMEIDSLERKAASARPASRQTGSASEPADAFPTPAKTPIPEASQAEQPTAMDSQAQCNSTVRSSTPCQTATSSAAAGPVSRQPATARTALPASPCFQKSIPPPAVKTALTPLAMGSGKTPFRAAATSPLTSFAGRAVSSSPHTNLSPMSLHMPLLTASRSTGKADNGKAMPFSSAQRSAQTSTGAFSMMSKPKVGSLLNSSKDRNGQSGGRFATSLLTKAIPLSQVPAKPASKTTGAFPSLFKQPLSTSSGSTRPAVTAAFGLTPAQKSVQTSLPAPSSKARGLPKAPLTSKTHGVAGTAPTTGATPHESVTNALSMHSSVRPVPGQGVHATSGQQAPESLVVNKQAAKPPEQSLYSNGPNAPYTRTQADTRPSTAHGSDETDAVVEEEVQGRQADAKLWTSTSLAAGLMGNMKHLEEMRLEIQQMHDDVLEHKVNVAISSNRLTRLDNPIVHDKLRSLKRQAETIFRAAAEPMQG